MTVTLNVSTVGLSTLTGEKLDPASSTSSVFYWYIAMMNGAIYSQGSSDISADYGDRYFDFAYGEIQLDHSASATLTANWAADSGGITDKHC